MNGVINHCLFFNIPLFLSLADNYNHRGYCGLVFFNSGCTDYKAVDN